MLIKIKNKLENELLSFTEKLDKTYSLSSISPLLYKYIREYVLREGKRVRPTLFVIGFSGFSKKRPEGLYTSALSMELLHDFMLVHDDIIDKSDTRRGLPSMHKKFNAFLKKYPGLKFDGEDLAIVAGDVMYAMGINAFLEVDVDTRLKEKALKILNRAALFTGCGEFIELLYGVKDIKNVTKDQVYKIYDYKTAYYTFASPLAIGAVLAGADKKDADILLQYGILLGRAFQIKDDFIGMFSDEKKIGKSTLTDLQEAKKTILIWHAYNHSPSGTRKTIKSLLSKKNADMNDLLRMQRIITGAGSLDYARQEINKSIEKAQYLIEYSGINRRSKEFLKDYSQEILKT